MTEGKNTDTEDNARQALVVATRILVQQGLMDTFGHVSLRHPTSRDKYLLATSVAPSEVSVDNVVTFDLESKPVDPVSMPLYAERFIHGSIYSLRPDIDAICHFHPRDLMPFCITDTRLIPVSRTGACMGAVVPVWDSQDKFGDTSLLVTNQEQGDSLASALGDEWVILMRHHGACIAGRDVRELVYRSVYTCRDAEALTTAASHGSVMPMSLGEIERTAHPAAAATERCWRHLSIELEAARGRA